MWFILGQKPRREEVDIGVNQKLPIPPLEGSDRLFRHEFERRYHAALPIQKAELIEGVVYVASPVRARSHAQPHGRIITWLGVYEAAIPGVDLHDNATVRLVFRK